MEQISCAHFDEGVEEKAKEKSSICLQCVQTFHNALIVLLKI